ncbi:AAA family ATPase [Prevotella sp. Rep29]|uniref:AAA family ATPase n=1 Tax=Prevotella sp. Rep29 TaxID=2691580 RepID=UPI001C6EA4D7|nr:AAA family ATPase [Prevotella sp. Rep29]QYR09751.1 ATP-binding protein [Prevotella sp. Rep29]
MKEYITIKEFGPLKNIENLEIKPFTVLIGESASGKSTLMKVVAMMRYIYKMANIRSYLYHSNITKSPFRLRLDSMLKRQGMTKMFTKDSLIIYRVQMDDDISYEVRIENGNLKKTEVIEQQHLMLCKNSYVSENRNIIPTWAQTSWKNKGATLGFYFHETNDDFGCASEGEKKLEMDFVGMKMLITHPKGKPTRYQIVPTDGHHAPIELTEASSGIQTSAPLALIVDYFAKDFSFKDAFKRSVMNFLFEAENLDKFNAVIEPQTLLKVVDIHIEEPELSLFPDAQCKLVENIYYTALHAENDRTLNIMLATHSPYILNYLNIVLNQTKEGKAKLTNENLAVYGIHDGKTMNLLMKDDKGRDIVDTLDLTEMMSAIFNEYTELTND